MWLLDLRKVAAVTIKPNATKEEDYHLALASFLHKELKSNNINSTKQNVMLKIALNGMYKDRYHTLVIDCLSGKMYLKGDKRQRFFGRLRRFATGKSKADAYHCFAQSAQRIINRINKIQASISSIKTAEKFYDIFPEEYESYDIGDRDGLFVLLNGEVFTDYNNISHTTFIQQIMDGTMSDSNAKSYSRFLRYNSEQKSLDWSNAQFACGHILIDKNGNKCFLIDDGNLQNITVNDAAKTIKEQTDANFVYAMHDDTGGMVDRLDLQKVAKKKIKRLIATHDVLTRDYAVLYIDGKLIISRGTHSEMINEYLNEKQEIELEDNYYRPNGFNRRLNQNEEEIDNDTKTIQNNVSSLAFIHLVGEDFYIETKSLFNVDLNTVVNKIKSEFPESNIYDDDDDEYKKLAKKTLLSRHSVEIRQQAIVYIDGLLITGKNHTDAIDDFNKQAIEKKKEIIRNYCFNKQIDIEQIDKIINNFLNTQQLPDDIYQNLSQEEKDIITKDYDKVPIAFIHKDPKNKALFIETDANDVLNVDTIALQDIINKLKSEFPSYSIYDDDSTKEYTNDVNQYKKIANKK